MVLGEELDMINEEKLIWNVFSGELVFLTLAFGAKLGILVNWWPISIVNVNLVNECIIECELMNWIEVDCSCQIIKF